MINGKSSCSSASNFKINLLIAHIFTDVIYGNLNPSLSNKAATAESTPPDKATATRNFLNETSRSILIQRHPKAAVLDACFYFIFQPQRGLLYSIASAVCRKISSSVFLLLFLSFWCLSALSFYRSISIFCFLLVHSLTPDRYVGYRFARRKLLGPVRIISLKVDYTIRFDKLAS